jgi:hypothetical protein
MSDYKVYFMVELLAEPARRAAIMATHAAAIDNLHARPIGLIVLSLPAGQTRCLI